nr:PREDICTED: protein POF1B [Opisthocomus hoazin]
MSIRCSVVVGKPSPSPLRTSHDIEFTCQTEDIEDLIPKGLSEATKQQIRYLLQMRVTSDKSLRLVLSTFKNLREELCHLQDDLGKLETDSVLLKKDLAFKDSQVKEYETMLASLRENNRQQQQGLRESTAKCRSLEEQLLSLRLGEGEKDCRLKELEYCKRSLEQEIQSLKLQTCSNPTLQTTTDELSSRYVEMINNLREDKDREIRSLRSQLCQFQEDISKREGNNSDLQIRLHELTSMVEEKDAFIKQQQEELFRLKHEKLSGSQSPGVTAVITKKYRNQYPILGLLSDDYKVTSPVNKSQTIVIERTGEIWKHCKFQLKQNAFAVRPMCCPQCEGCGSGPSATLHKRCWCVRALRLQSALNSMLTGTCTGTSCHAPSLQILK